MADFATIPGGAPTAAEPPPFPQPCSQCLIILFFLALVTAIFMVTCVVLSFKVSHMSQQRSRRSRIAPSAPAAMDLWASPPISHSQSTLLKEEGPAANPLRIPAFSPEWDEVVARQPRVTLRDLDEFWWRSNATAV